MDGVKDESKHTKSYSIPYGADELGTLHVENFFPEGHLKTPTRTMKWSHKTIIEIQVSPMDAHG